VRNLFIQFTLTSNSVVERTLLCGTPASWSKKSEIIVQKSELCMYKMVSS